MIDEIVDADINTSNNTNALPDGNNDNGKQIGNNINIRGGQDRILPRGDVGIIKKQFNNIATAGNKLFFIILKPIATILARQINNVPAVKAIYDKLKTVKTVVASILGLVSMRLIARFDYWALILCDELPIISVDQKAVLSIIRRM
jgi:hypothetical protein